ncbi:MAG: hypothetical protein V5A14_03110 [Desulfohalobiaceae bacterium]
MKRSIFFIALSVLLAGLLAAAPAMAQDDEAEARNDEMQVVDQNERPEDVDKELSLPKSASEQGKESSSYGLDTANEAREKDREFGQERAQEAGEMANERAEEARERARERADEAKEQTRGEKVGDQVRDRDAGQNNRP